MPKKPAPQDLPATLQRSPAKAQRTFAETHDAAVEQYGEGERAHRTAFASVKRGFEKVGDHWEAKDEKGPSDDRAAGDTTAETHGGVDAHATKDHLMGIAQRLDVEGRSKMTKDELVEAIDKANRRETSKSSRS
jgi:cation transport regulator ChaB